MNYTQKFSNFLVSQSHPPVRSLKTIGIILFIIIGFINPVYAAEDLKKQNEKILANLKQNTVDIKDIKYQQELITSQKNNDSINYKKEIAIPVALSILAGFIFWIIFQVLPSFKRKRKLRPKIEKDLIHISSRLHHMFDLVMTHRENNASNFHEEIIDNNLTKDLINLGLQNKALNETYLFDQFSNNLVIGDKLFDYVDTIDIKIDRIFNFSDQLSANEILVLEEIHQALNVYDFSNFNEPYRSISNGVVFTPKDPTLAFLTPFLYDIYVLCDKLNRIISSSCLDSRDILLNKIYYLKSKNKHKDVIRLINQKKKLYKEDEIFLEWIVFDTMYLINKNKAYKMLEKLVKNTPHLVYYRGQIKNFINDNNAIKIIKENSAQNNYQTLFAEIEREENIKKSFIKINTLIKKSINT